MTDAPLTAAQRAEIQRQARARAERMGLAPMPVQDAPPPVELPTENVFALRGLLRLGRLTAEQERAARRFLADADAAARQTAHTDPTPGDAA